MPTFAAPNINNDPDRILQNKCSTDMQNVKCRIGLPSDFLREVVGKNRKAKNCCGTHTCYDRPDHIGGDWHTEDERKLGRNEHGAYDGKDDLRANAATAKPLSYDAKKQSSATKRDGHGEEVPHNFGMIELFDICEPGRCPQPLQGPSVLMHMVDSGASRQNRWSA